VLETPRRPHINVNVPSSPRLLRQPHVQRIRPPPTTVFILAHAHHRPVLGEARAARRRCCPRPRVIQERLHRRVQFARGTREWLQPTRFLAMDIHITDATTGAARARACGGESRGGDDIPERNASGRRHRDDCRMMMMSHALTDAQVCIDLYI